MAAPSKSRERAPAQRSQLPRKRQSFRADFRMDIYEKLLTLPRLKPDGQPESLVGVIERLIADAAQQPTLPMPYFEFVRSGSNSPHRMA